MAAVLGATTALAACGGSSPSSKNASVRHSSDAGTRVRLAECMRTHGVPNFPDLPSNGAFGVSQGSSASKGSGNGPNSISIDGRTLDASAPAFQRAMQQCQRYAPQGPVLNSAQLASLKQGALKMAKCMRSHGVPNFADPTVGLAPGGHGIAVRMGLGNTGGSQARLNPASPAFQHAMQICQPLMRASLKQRTG